MAVGGDVAHYVSTHLIINRDMKNILAFCSGDVVFLLHLWRISKPYQI